MYFAVVLYTPMRILFPVFRVEVEGFKDFTEELKKSLSCDSSKHYLLKVEDVGKVVFQFLSWNSEKIKYSINLMSTNVFNS